MIVQLKTQISTLEQWCRTIFGTSAGLDSQRDRRKTERSRTLKYCRIFCKYFPLCQKLVNKMITTQIWWPRLCIQRDRGSRCRHWGTWWNGLQMSICCHFDSYRLIELFFCCSDGMEWWLQADECDSSSPFWNLCCLCIIVCICRQLVIFLFLSLYLYLYICTLWQFSHDFVFVFVPVGTYLQLSL